MDMNQGKQQDYAHAAPHVSMTEIALRGTALLFDIQLQTARNLMQMQARTAAALGAPDYSDLFQVADERAKRLFEASTEQILVSARHANETVAEMQRQFSRLMEKQTVELTEEMRQGIEQLGERTQQGLQEVKQMVEREADVAERTLQQAGEAARSNGSSAQSTTGQAVQQGQQSQQTQSPILTPTQVGQPRSDGERSDDKGRARRA